MMPNRIGLMSVRFDVVDKLLEAWIGSQTFLNYRLAYVFFRQLAVSNHPVVITRHNSFDRVSDNGKFDVICDFCQVLLIKIECLIRRIVYIFISSICFEFPKIKSVFNFKQGRFNRCARNLWYGKVTKAEIVQMHRHQACSTSNVCADGNSNIQVISSRQNRICSSQMPVALLVGTEARAIWPSRLTLPLGPEWQRTPLGNRHFRATVRPSRFPQYRQQMPLDRRLPRRRGDLRPRQIRHVKRIDRLLAEGDDMGGADVEVELRERGGQVVE
jgi:hypothetical protein